MNDRFTLGIEWKINKLFIDDLEKNVLKAQELGIKTIHLIDYTKLEEELRESKII